MIRRATIAALVLLTSCHRVRSAQIPDDVAFVARIVLAEDGSIVSSTGLLEPGAILKVDAENERTYFVGFRDVPASPDRASTPLERATGCDPALPAPSWVARANGDHLDPAGVSAIPRLTARWLSAVCPILAPSPRTVPAACNARSCPAELEQTGCTLRIALAPCDLPAIEARIHPDGHVCIDPASNPASCTARDTVGLEETIRFSCGAVASCRVDLFANAGMSCAPGEPCSLDACFPAYADCDGNPQTGCEADLRRSNDHCGECNSACNGLCSAGFCQRGIIDLAIGDHHACFVRGSGAVECWGRNDMGQVGTLTQSGFVTGPQRVSNVANARKLALGSRHTCALLADRSALCWGFNKSRQVDPVNEDFILEPTPQSTFGITGELVELASGPQHNCAIRADGTVVCWGADDYGQSGRNGIGDFGVIDGVEDARELALGVEHSCALLRNGELTCWGRDVNHLALDEPAFTISTPPRATCAALVSGGVLCNGTGYPSPITFPFQDVVQLRAFEFGSCALDRTGAISCRGSDDHGIFQSAGELSLALPTRLPEPVSARLLAARGLFACAVDDANRVVCWGSNAFGTLGVAEDPRVTTPSVVRGLPPIAHVDLGSTHGCAIDRSGRAWCWGSNTDGQIGTPASAVIEPPHDVGLEDVVSIAAASTHTCAVLGSGEVRCWGANTRGQLGAGDEIRHAGIVAVRDLTDAIAIDTGYRHTCVLRRGGRVSCFGANDYGQSGTMTGIDVLAPEERLGLGTVTAFSSGGYHSCVVLESGGTACFGYNNMWQLGSRAADAELVTPMLDQHALAISAGTNHTCAKLEDQSAGCWGNNNEGQLGDGEIIRREDAAHARVSGPIDSVAAGGGMSCAIMVDRSVECWGLGASRELEDMGYGPVPIRVPGVSDVVELSAGEGGACAVIADGRVVCWGWNGFGELDPTKPVRSIVPREVARGD